MRDDAGNLVEAGEWAKRYVDELTSKPGWQKALEEKNKAAKLAKRKARDARREATLRARMAA
jgi:hypothetical protein